MWYSIAGNIFISIVVGLVIYVIGCERGMRMEREKAQKCSDSDHPFIRLKDGKYYNLINSEDYCEFKNVIEVKEVKDLATDFENLLENYWYAIRTRDCTRLPNEQDRDEKYAQDLQKIWTPGKLYYLKVGKFNQDGKEDENNDTIYNP